MDEHRFKKFKDRFDLVVIGCSAGGIEALRLIFNKIEPSYRIPIAVVQHRSPNSPSIMVKYFSEITQLPVIEPDDKEPIQKGHIYFAPPNYHLLVAPDKRFNLNVDEAVYYSRPAIDVLFATAAEVYKDRLVGIIMSGANADGAEGLKKIKELGGLTIVQDPRTAYSPQMPEAAVNVASPDLVLNLNEIDELIHAL